MIDTNWAAEECAASRLMGPGGPFELEQVPGIDGPRSRFKANPHTLAELFAGLERHGTRGFVSDGEANLTYAAFMRRAMRGVAWLQSRKLGPGCRVVLAPQDRVAWTIGFAAISMAGASVVVAPWGQEARALAATLARVDYDWTITGDEHWLRGNEQVFDDTANISVKSITPAPADEALISFTSGSSGPPKPVVIDHYGLLAGMRTMMLSGVLASLRKIRSASGAAPNRPLPPCAMLMAPLSHVAGYGQFLLTALIGGRIILPRRWNVREALQTVQNDGVRSIIGLTPDMVRSLLQHDLAIYDTTSLATVGFYGAAPPEAIVKSLQMAFPSLEVGTSYGLTETNGSIALATSRDSLLHPGTAGKVSPAALVRIVGPDDSAVPPGVRGEIWISGPMLAKGYLTGTDASRTRFQDGWLRTGDFGRMDETGFLYIDEREAELIRCGDAEISCLEIESVAHCHVLVCDAAAFGMTDPSLGQQPVLAVVSATEEVLDVCEIAAYVQARHPVSNLMVVQVDQIPRSSSGKIDRLILPALVPDTAR